jgi:hypothetical protein
MTASLAGGAASALGFSSPLFWIVFGTVVVIGVFNLWAEKRELQAVKELSERWGVEADDYSASDLNNFAHALSTAKTFGKDKAR